MKRFVLVALFAFCSSAMVAEGVSGSYTPYPAREYHVTAPPAGFKFFYVSHYGRHGSRYLLGEQEFSAVDILRSHSDALSPKGQALLTDLECIKNAHEGMLGMLSEKGLAQHYGIGRNMARHLKGVFRSGKRRIRCISSPAPRCIQSMSSCVLGLRDGGAKCDVRMDAGYKYYAVISPRMDDSAWRSVAAGIRDSILIAGDVPNVLGGLLFRPGQAPEAPGLLTLALGMYCMGAAAAGMEGDIPDVLGRYVPPSALDVMRRAENAFDYCLFCETADRGNIRMELTAKPVLRDMLDKAGEAISSGDIAADLRFGHDSGLLPLMQLTGIGPFAKQYKPEKAFDAGWHNDEMIPMAANLQLVFCRNARGKVLVKFLYNEAEMPLPALTPFHGSWYDWDLVETLFRRVCSQP